MIRKSKKPGVWILKSKNGKKTLGKFHTKKAAEERLRQIEAFKHMK